MAVTASSLPQPARASDPTRQRASSRDGWILAGIVALAVAIRLPTVGEQSFWYDEAITHGIVAHGLGHVLSTVPKTESTPPLYYVLVWLWSRVFGVQEAGLRSFSVLLGTLTIPVVWTLGRKLVSTRVAHIAGLLTAVNPILFWYSQEARSYALLVLLSAASLLALVWALEAPSVSRLAIWAATAAVALATHYFAIFLLVPEVVWLVLALRREGLARFPRLAVALAPVALVGAALVPLAIHQDNGRASYIATQSGSLAFRIAQLVKQDIVAFDEPAKVITSILAVVLVAVGLLVLTRRSSRPERIAVAPLLAVGVGAVLLAVIAAVIGTDYVNTRNLLPSWPALAVAVSAGFGAAAAPRMAHLALAALVALSIVCVVGVITTPIFQRPDWRGAADAMGRPTVPRAIVGDREAGVAMAPHLAPFSYFPAGADVQEVDVFSLIHRPAGAHESQPPPRPNPPPAIQGFTLFARRETSSYTVLRYRAPAAVLESRSSLQALGLIPHGQFTVLLQEPGEGSSRP